MTVSLFSRCCLHSVLLLCICSCSYGVVSAQSDGNVASGSKTDFNEDGPAPTRSYAEVISNVSEGSTSSELGMQLGDRCEVACSTRLSHVICDERSGLCECDKRFPVRLGAATGCAKPVALGSQCLHAQTCSFTDQNAECTQINHNAVCQCKPGYHVVSFQKPSKRVFCSPDTVILSGTDVHTLFAVATGLAILSGLICFVLKLFSRARYSRPRHYANANLAPPILFSSETGSRRPSLASIHSSASSSRSMSFSARRFERDLQQREARQAQLAAQAALAAAAAQAQVLAGAGGISPGDGGLGGGVGGLGFAAGLGLRSDPPPAPSPSPRTPMSTDELLPSVSEVKEEETATPILSHRATCSSYQGEIGPCSSSDTPH